MYTKRHGIGWTKMIMSKKNKKRTWSLLEGLEELDFCEEKTVGREAEEESQELSIFTPPDDEEDDIAEDSSRLATAKKLSASEWAEILRNRNDFAVWNGRLHIYIEKFGYWRMVKSTNDNREIRQLFEPEERHFINKHMLGDVGRILRTFKIKKNVEVTDNGKIII